MDAGVRRGLRSPVLVHAAVFLIGVLAGTVLALWAASGATVALPAISPERPPLAHELDSFSGTFAPAVRAASKAVVSITASRAAQPQSPLEFFFGPPGPGSAEDPEGGADPELRQEGIGSGVIVTPDGYLLTNLHVIDGASRIEVRLADDREFDAEVVGGDRGTDLAVLRVDAEELPALPLGNSESVRIGDFVLAIGNPFDVGQTVTMGIVSATGRGGMNLEAYEDFIQTDAAINPGNSGGALIDAEGKLIGINTAIVAGGPAGVNQGVGFAVPVNMAHRVMEQLIENGKVARGYLGVGIQDVDSAMARTLGAPDASGALISEVDPGSPAANAGLKQGDIIRELNGEAVRDARNLRLAVASIEPGSTVQLTIWRDKSARNVKAALGAHRASGQPASSNPRPQPMGALDGVTLEELDAAAAGEFGLRPETKGVAVADVLPGSPAFEAGLRPGDVIEMVSREPVGSVATLREAVAKAGLGPVLLLVNRGGAMRFFAIEPRPGG